MRDCMRCNLKSNYRLVQKIWYKKSILAYILFPFSLLFFIIISIRRWLYRVGIFHSMKFSVPVIVVGNITVGGTGKTPLIIYLAESLKQKGYTPGIVSRGYGSKMNKEPRSVVAESSFKEVGDEPLLIFSRTQCSVWICADRIAAVEKILSETNCNVILSDDGLQHYALKRDMEIAVVDSERQFGNGFMLPAGPLRETKSRLKEVDFVVMNGKKSNFELDNKIIHMQLKPDKIYNLMDSKKILDINKTKTAVHAVAGIGNPQRFFKALRSLGLTIVEHPYPDHYQFQLSDLSFDDNFPVIITEKDAVKCKSFKNENLWCLRVNTTFEVDFVHALLQKFPQKSISVDLSQCF